MPKRRIIITQEASNELYRNFGVTVPPGQHESHKGDIGAILIRYGISRSQIRVAVAIAREYGCTEEDIPEEKPRYNRPSVRSMRPSHRQLSLDLGRLEVDETYYLKPDGRLKRRRRRRR